MQSRKDRNCPGKDYGAATVIERCRLDKVVILAGLLTIATLSGGAQGPPIPHPNPSIHPPELTNPPDANAQMRMHEQQEKHRSFEAANAERKRQLADDSARLLKMATDLKAEVDKTDKDTLSLNVIRRADEIERLAHLVKEKMKLTVGGG
jgi:hypothetical protein